MKFRKNIAGLFILLCSAVFAQNPLVPSGLIAADANRIHMPADSGAFLNLFRQMDALSDSSVKTIRVAHIGGSHVQAGIWTNTFISGMQERFKTAGGGYFVFPYRLARSNSAAFSSSFSNTKWNYCRSVGANFCQPLGMCALNVSTGDSLVYFGAKLTRLAACKFVNEVLVFHNFSPSFRLELAPTNNVVERKDDEARGYTRFVFDMLVDSVSFQVTRLDTAGEHFTLFGISFENSLTSGVYCAGMGANGASCSSFLKSPLLVSQLATIKPDLVILSLGVNDSQSPAFNKADFVQNYDTLIDRIREASPGAAILLTTTTDNYVRRKYSNKRTIVARQAMFELKDRKQVAVWDMFTLMGGYRSMPRWQRAGLAAKDKVHFTPRGYVVVGNLMLEAFLDSYEQSKKSPQ